MHVMENPISLDLEAHARMDLMVHGAMWMRRGAVPIMSLIMETLFLCPRAMVKQQPIAPGVSGVAGVAALPHVEEEIK